MTASTVTAEHVAMDEARAEVDVLNSHLEKSAQLTKKIRACLGRLETSGHKVDEAVAPLKLETARIQAFGQNVVTVLAAIDRLRRPADSKEDEEQIIHAGPERAGLSNYLASLKRLNKSVSGMKASKLRVTQHTMADLSRLLKSGNSQLESHFGKLLRDETPRSIEPLHYITKNISFPVLPADKLARLGLIYSYLSSTAPQAGQEAFAARAYVDIRGPYIASSLANLAAASVTTAKKTNMGATYRAGTSGIRTYARAMQNICLSEYENICRIFIRDDWSPTFHATCQPAVAELARTIRELNGHIKSHLSTDCFLAYEIIEILTSLSEELGKTTGELRASVLAAMKPVRETAKVSLSELLEESRRKISSLQSLPVDGAPASIVPEVVQRLQAMVVFLRPISSIMISLGNDGWKATSTSSDRSGDLPPSLASFDVNADGTEIFASYCVDTFDVVLSSLEQRARAILRSKATTGVLLVNCVVVIEHMVRDSDLGPLLSKQSGVLEQWRKRSTALYTDVCKDLSAYLFDTIHTNRTQRPTSGPTDSASVIKGLSSKDKDKIKERFSQFNSTFDDMVSRHKRFHMEKEVRRMFAEDIRQKLQPLYDRFWDRYHEIDKGKGKHVKYDKAAISTVFLDLSS